ncbi:hypothetical protein LPJ70_000722, partial [Coemansia sp. RSA 2708]
MSDADSISMDFDGSPTQATQPTQPTQATQKPPRNISGNNPGVFAKLVSRHPHLAPLAMETDRLLNGGYTIGRFDECDITLDRSYISGRHCRLYMETDSNTGKLSLYIVDTSTFGTITNGVTLGRGNRTVLLDRDRVGFLEASDGLASDVGLEYSVELVNPDDQVKEQKEFDAKLLRTYDFKREIGSGAFAKVWLTIHKQTGMACACKVINKKRHLFSSGLSKVFEREISIMSKLRHDNIVPLHELRTDSDRIHIFMEYLEGGDMLTYINDNGPLSESNCRPLFKQLCSAVRYLHSNGITHRDIKLDNILIKGATNKAISVVKIADFGLARAVGDGDMMRTVCGTPSYLAPEIVCRSSSTASYDIGVDIWALGVVLYTMHLNSFPFAKNLLNGGAGGSSPEAYLKACQLNAENETFTGLSQELQDLVSSMLQINPELRLGIDAVIHHPWTQTSVDGTPGPVHEAAEIWGALKLDTIQAGEQQHISIDLFRRQTIIGRSRQSHIQIMDPRISSQHCEIIFRDSSIYLRNTGRSMCWVGSKLVGNDHVQVLHPPYEFSLCAKRSGSDKDASPQRPEYRLRIEVFSKPWKVAWITSEHAREDLENTLPPPLVLPVQSSHLSHLPFGGAKA